MVVNVLEETNAGVEVGGREGFVTKVRLARNCLHSVLHVLLLQHIALVAAETKASAWLPTPAGVAQAGQAKIAEKVDRGGLQNNKLIFSNCSPVLSSLF